MLFERCTAVEDSLLCCRNEPRMKICVGHVELKQGWKYIRSAREEVPTIYQERCLKIRSSGSDNSGGYAPPNPQA